MPQEALRAISDPDPAVRLRAAKWIAKQTLGETSNEVEAWIANAAAMTPIIAALDDSDPRVAENAVIAVALATQRYFKDRRAYPGVLRLLKSKRALTRMWAVEAARWLRGKGCLDDVLPLLDDKAKNVRHKVLVVITSAAGGKLDPQMRERLLVAVRPILKDHDWVLRRGAASALGVVGDRSQLDELKRALKNERNRFAREYMGIAIERIERKS